jgi:hypothetical protein
MNGSKTLRFDPAPFLLWYDGVLRDLADRLVVMKKHLLAHKSFMQAASTDRSFNAITGFGGRFAENGATSDSLVPASAILKESFAEQD